MNSIISNRILPAIKNMFLGFFGYSQKRALSYEKYDALTALKCSISYNTYGGYCVPNSSRHRPAAQKILANDVYEPRTIEFIISNCI